MITGKNPSGGDQSNGYAEKQRNSRSVGLRNGIDDEGEDKAGQIDGQRDDGQGFLRQEQVVLQVQWHVHLGQVDEHSGQCVDAGDLPKAERAEPRFPAGLATVRARGLRNFREQILLGVRYGFD